VLHVVLREVPQVHHVSAGRVSPSHMPPLTPFPSLTL
jgi:hypothetical protein